MAFELIVSECKEFASDGQVTRVLKLMCLSVSMTMMINKYVSPEKFDIAFKVAFLAVASFIALQVAKLSESVSQIEITNQTMATRANAMEWRSCLSFGAQWHKKSLQSA